MRNEEIMIPSLHSLMIKLTEVPLVRIATCNFPFRLIRQLTMVTLKLSYIYIYLYIFVIICTTYASTLLLYKITQSVSLFESHQLRLHDIHTHGTLITLTLFPVFICYLLVFIAHELASVFPWLVQSLFQRCFASFSADKESQNKFVFCFFWRGLNQKFCGILEHFVQEMTHSQETRKLLVFLASRHAYRTNRINYILQGENGFSFTREDLELPRNLFFFPV